MCEGDGKVRGSRGAAGLLREAGLQSFLLLFVAGAGVGWRRAASSLTITTVTPTMNSSVIPARV